MRVTFIGLVDPPAEFTLTGDVTTLVDTSGPVLSLQLVDGEIVVRQLRPTAVMDARTYRAWRSALECHERDSHLPRRRRPSLLQALLRLIRAQA